MSELANVEQYQAWNGESGRRWVSEADRRDRVLGPVAEALLGAAAPSPGEQVLDVGCGCGVTTLAAARAVAPGGAAWGIDLSGPMLGLARARAADAGVANATFTQGDAQAHPLPAGRFSLMISRFGTLFFGEPVAAFANLASALAPGARAWLATWRPLGDNEWLTVPAAALARYGEGPEATTGAPGMFGQAEPDAVAATLAGAGFADVEAHPVEVTLTFGVDAAEATDYVVTAGPGRAMFESLPDDLRCDAWESVRAALEGHTDAGGTHLGAAIWLVTAKLRP